MKQSLQRRFNYIMATNLPCDTSDAAQQVDKSLQKVMTYAWGSDLWKVDREAYANMADFVAIRSALPCKYGGTGVEKTESFVHTSFVNSVTQCVSRFFSVASSDDVAGQTGLFEHLRPLFGLSANDLDRGWVPERRPDAMAAWFDWSARQPSPRTVGNAYVKAWTAITQAGATVDGQHLTKRDILDIQAIAREQNYLGDEPNDNSGNNEPAGDANPLNWSAKDIIKHSSHTKIQWFVRQAISKATWKQLRWKIANLARLPSGELAHGEGGDFLRQIANEAMKDPRFLSFVHADKFSRAPLTGICSEVPFRNDEFIEYISHYFGLPSPATRALAGKPLKRGSNTRFHLNRVDPEGILLLTAANGPGGLRTKQHNEMQDTLITEATRARIEARPGQVIGTEAALRISNWQSPGIIDPAQDADDAPLHSQIRPDVIIKFPNRRQIPFKPQQKPPQGTKMLFDVKTLGLVNRYYTRAALLNDKAPNQDTESPAVRARARKVHSEYMTKARERDERFLTEEQRNGDTRETGPFTRALASFGRVQGLVF